MKVQSEDGSRIMFSCRRVGALFRIASLSTSETHSNANPERTCCTVSIAEAATPARSVMIFLTAIGDSLRHSCSILNHKNSRLSSFCGT